MSGPKESTRTGSRFLIAGMLAALGSSACCVGPLVLLVLGISGSWIGSLTALEPYRPIFIGLTLLFLTWAFHRLYLARQVCTPGSACANPRTLKPPARTILDRYDTVAWPDRDTVACPSILLTI